MSLEMAWGSIHWKSQQWSYSKQSIISAKIVARTHTHKSAVWAPGVWNGSLLCKQWLLCCTCCSFHLLLVRAGPLPCWPGDLQVMMIEDIWWELNGRSENPCVPAPLETEFYNIWCTIVVVAPWYRTQFMGFHFTGMPIFSLVLADSHAFW